MTRYVVLAGCVLIAAMVMFPPYQGVYRRSRTTTTRFMGYYSFFSPPDSKAVWEEIWDKSWDRDFKAWVSEDGRPGRTWEDHHEYYTSHIDTDRLHAQLVAIVLITCGVAFAFRQREHKRTGPDTKPPA